jgi:U4/U6 small nuclear ribonucleoprotein PRP3
LLFKNTFIFNYLTFAPFQGRTVDASGQEIQLTHHVPTLKANLRAKQSAELKEQQKPAPAAASEAKPDADSKFFDARVMGKAAVRQKRMAFTFNEPGKFEAEGNRLRMKAKLEQLQADISTIARKTGITSATQLAKLVPKDADKGRVPDVEWWDAHIMADNEYPAEEDAQVRYIDVLVFVMLKILILSFVYLLKLSGLPPRGRCDPVD